MHRQRGLVMYQLEFTKQANKDAKKAADAGFKNKILELFEIIKKNPYQSPPSYEKLVGDLSGALSRRINIQHRLVYHVFENEKTIRILRMWSHYE